MLVDTDTIHTIEVLEKPIFKDDPTVISGLERELRDLGIEGATVSGSCLYTIANELDSEQLEKIAALVHSKLTQEAYVDTPISEEKKWDFAIKVDFKPGVTDNAARVLKADAVRANVGEGDFYTSAIHYISGEYNSALEEQLVRIASNPQIHDITVINKDDFLLQGGFERKIHPVILGERDHVFDVDIGSMDEAELVKTGKLGTFNIRLVIPEEKNPDEFRGGTLALASDYMNEIKRYSLSEKHTGAGRTAGVLTDTELEVLAQMWSEHCRHSLYNASIPESEEGIFDCYIKRPTLRALKGKEHLGLSIFKDNAGVFKFNDKWNIAIKNETHNSPSALDPYGGAITGIVGVNRDPAGTGLGAEIIANFLFYYFGHPDDTRRYFKSKSKEGNLENLLLNPGQIYRGVNKGVIDGGNQKGYAINQGTCVYHDRYNGKPIVGVGCIGIMPAEIKGKPSYEKHIDVGDRVYIVGGRAGRDGIHGATFSSEELSANSPATAVQIGDAYTQKKMFGALIELRDKGYIKFITDLGAGGVSCAALEMAEQTNGIYFNLDNLLTKYPGMTATELLLNESQERMAIAVDESHKDEIEEILKKHEVEFSDIGYFTDSGRAVVESQGQKVVDLDMDFLHKGYPKRALKPEEYRLSEKDEEELMQSFEKFEATLSSSSGTEQESLTKVFLEMASRPNLSSIADFMDRMDSTVQGLAVQHCIQGKGRVTTKTSCITPLRESNEGLIHSYGHTERQSYIDSEKMGKNAFLRAIGNNVAMGGNLDWMVATDQALWQSSDDGKYQQMLIEANKGMAEVIEKGAIPVISGKDSMYNQATVFDEAGNVVKRGVFPTLFMNVIAKIDDVSKIVTVDAKEEGDLVYVVGSVTKDDIGGSEYMNMCSEKNGVEYNIGRVSDEDTDDVFDTFRKMNKAVDKGLLQSAKYVEAGGIAIAVRDTAMAGELGIEYDLGNVDAENMSISDLMYSETEGRFLVTVSRDKVKEFKALFGEKATKIGKVKGDRVRMAYYGDDYVDVKVDDLFKMHHHMDKAA